MNSTTRAALLSAAFAILAIGCDTGNDPGLPSSVNFDAAVVAADGALEDLRMMHGPNLGLPGIVFPPLVGGKPDCPVSGGQFHCPPIGRDGLEYTRNITYLDASGTPQAEYDEATTASIRYEISVEGEITREWWTASIDRERDLIVTGLLDDDGVVTWNGTGLANVQRSRHTDSGEVRSYIMLSNSEILYVVIPHPRTEDGWPLSGSITRQLTITRSSGTGDTETVERTATVVFNGTQFVPVTVGDETFTLDLDERHFGPGKMRRRRGRPGLN